MRSLAQLVAEEGTLPHDWVRAIPARADKVGFESDCACEFCEARKALRRRLKRYKKAKERERRSEATLRHQERLDRQHLQAVAVAHWLLGCHWCCELRQQEAVVLLRKHSGMSDRSIGRLFGVSHNAVARAAGIRG